LGFNIILSLLLIKPLGASGLALASSLSGILLLILTLKEFGNFHIFKLKYMLLYVVSMVIFVILNNYLKDYLGHL
jgi:putative peptidoglycan lipid II flippase